VRKLPKAAKERDSVFFCRPSLFEQISEEIFAIHISLIELYRSGRGVRRPRGTREYGGTAELGKHEDLHLAQQSLVFGRYVVQPDTKKVSRYQP